jgi:hypothetical protein
MKEINESEITVTKRMDWWCTGIEDDLFRSFQHAIIPILKILKEV